MPDANTHPLLQPLPPERISELREYLQTGYMDEFSGFAAAQLIATLDTLQKRCEAAEKYIELVEELRSDIEDICDDRALDARAAWLASRA
jgi:tRNA 2-selenouridine synthase SelU